MATSCKQANTTFWKLLSFIKDSKTYQQPSMTNLICENSDFQLLTIFARSSIPDFWHNSKQVSLTFLGNTMIQIYSKMIQVYIFTCFLLSFFLFIYFTLSIYLIIHTYLVIFYLFIYLFVCLFIYVLNYLLTYVFIYFLLTCFI